MLHLILSIKLTLSHVPVTTCMSNYSKSPMEKQGFSLIYYPKYYIIMGSVEKKVITWR